MAIDNIRDIIFKAAVDEFIEKGFDGARMQAIADRGGINKALLHYHYKNKESLYEHVFKSIFREFFSSIITNISPDLDIKDYLKAFISNYIDNVAQRKHLLKFVIWELENEGKNIGVMIREFAPASNPLTTFPIFKIIDKAKAEKKIRDVDSSHFILNIISMCLYPFIANRIVANIWNNQDINCQEFFDIRKKEIFDLIWNGIVV